MKSKYKYDIAQCVKSGIDYLRSENEDTTGDSALLTPAFNSFVNELVKYVAVKYPDCDDDIYDTIIDGILNNY